MPAVEIVDLVKLFTRREHGRPPAPPPPPPRPPPRKGPAPMPAVEIVALVKLSPRREHGRRVRSPALDGVSLTVARGECVAILGQNGSGKSTLVRVLATLLLHERGHARVFGHDVAREDRAVRRLVNRVSVEASFFKRMSAVENLAYAARFYGLTPARTRRRVPEILDAVGFPGHRAREPMEELSRGMQQKV